jgi:cytidylate kinase
MVAEREGLTLEKAHAMVEREDKNREEYYNYYTFGNWGVASNYDLCLDSSIAGIDGTAEIIIEFAKRAGLLPNE